jgi:autotransporter passenger strand-loop-strand repeat protein
LVLDGGTLSGTHLTGGGYDNLDSGTMVGTIVDSDGSSDIYGGTEISATVNSGGGEYVFNGMTVSTTVNSGGYEYVGHNSLNDSSGTGSGTIVNKGGALSIGSGGTAIDTVVNSGGVEVISLGGIASGTHILSGGAIDLTSLGFASGGTAVIDSVTDILTVTESTGTYTQQLTGNYTGEFFHLGNDGTGGTEVMVDGTPCYCRGTLILTDKGEVAVEDLRIGDRLVALSGAPRPVKWIGMRSYGGRFAMGNRTVLPVRIRQGAIAENVPRRDLWVSPLHAMYLDGVLVPATALVNESSITQERRVDKVEYFHLELETHDVIVAEGALSETYLDDDNRGMFLNAETYRDLYPGAEAEQGRYCAPRLEDGFEVESIRRKLNARAARLPAEGAAAAA